MHKNTRCNSSSDKFKSVNLIKRICSTETDKLADEISWSSSDSEGFTVKNVKPKSKRLYMSKKEDRQAITAQEKVQKWLEISDTTNGDFKKISRKKVPTKRRHKDNKIPTINYCELKSDYKLEEIDKSYSSDPGSPILPRTQTKHTNVCNKMATSTTNGNISHQTPNKTFLKNETKSPILRTRLKNERIEVKVQNEDKFKKIKNDCINESLKDKEHSSPILKTYSKKRKLVIENEIKVLSNTLAGPGRSMANVKKNLFPRSCNLELSQVSIDFIDTPTTADKEINTTTTQQSDKSAVIENLSETPKQISDASCQITTIPSNSNESESLEKLTVTFDATKQATLIESPVKKKRKKYPSDSVAGRLQKLIKKQKSSFSLWRHEHYLAKNSNFQIPAVKDECLTLKIVNLEEDCNRFIIRCCNVNNEDNYILVVNNYFIKQLTLSVDSIIRIFKPLGLFKIKSHCEELPEENVIVNVCRLEVLND